MPERARSIAWRHRGLRDGVEVLFQEADADGLRARGSTSAVQDGAAWAVSYEIDLDPVWVTRRARVTIQDADGRRTVELVATGSTWIVDGRPTPHLAGCVDVDLEASAFTNALPTHRLALAVGEEADVPAAFVSAAGTVQRLEQHYRRLPDVDGMRRFDYAAPAFDFRATLTYGRDGLVVDYPGLASRLPL